MGQLDVTPGNWSTGAGIVESLAGLATDIRSANDRDTAAVAASIGLGAIVAGLDVVAVGLDPVSKLVAVGLGWLIEHVRFLRKPLDLLAGDPIAVEHIAEQLHAAAQNLRVASRDLDPDALSQWQGLASEDFRVAAVKHRTRLDAASGMVDAVGYVVATNSALMAALRVVIRDMITSVLGDIIATMLTALATAAVTFGASLVVGLSRSIAAAVAWVANMFSKISHVIALTRRSAARIDDLVHGIGSLLASSSRRSAAPAPTPAPPPRVAGFHDDGLGDEVYRDWLRADAVLNGQPTTLSSPPVTSSGATAIPAARGSLTGQGTETGRAGSPERPSPTKRYEVPILNRHQTWLDHSGFGTAQRKAKFIEEWVKLNHPATYPYLKTVSDADSSKNYVGLGVKAATGFARQLTDIRERAEAAWNATERERRSDDLQ